MSPSGDAPSVSGAAGAGGGARSRAGPWGAPVGTGSFHGDAPGAGPPWVVPWRVAVRRRARALSGVSSGDAHPPEAGSVVVVGTGVTLGVGSGVVNDT